MGESRRITGGLTRTRRGLLLSAGMAAAGLIVPKTSCAGETSYPARNIQFIIPNAAGGAFDIYVRVVAPVMELYLPRRVSILPVNIPAGGGARGIAQLYRARPDGYTIGILNIPGVFLLQARQGSAAYDLDRFSWIGAIGGGEHYVLAAGIDSPLKTYADLKALSDQRPVKFAATGPEGTAYAATLIAARLLGLRPQIITGYKGSADYVVAAIRGDCDAVVTNRTAIMRFVRSNSVRILASFEPQSDFQGVPDAQALGQPELGEIVIERAVAAPPGLPVRLQALISDALGRALGDPKVVSWASENDLLLAVRTPAETAALVARQRAFFEKWKDVLAAG